MSFQRLFPDDQRCERRERGNDCKTEARFEIRIGEYYRPSLIIFQTKNEREKIALLSYEPFQEDDRDLHLF